jgi:hypothetical protein
MLGTVQSLGSRSFAEPLATKSVLDLLDFLRSSKDRVARYPQTLDSPVLLSLEDVGQVATLADLREQAHSVRERVWMVFYDAKTCTRWGAEWTNSRSNLTGRLLGVSSIIMYLWITGPVETADRVPQQLDRHQRALMPGFSTCGPPTVLCQRDPPTE